MDELAEDAGAIDERKWVSATEAAEMLHLCRKYMAQLAKAQGYTWRQANRKAPLFFLRKEIEIWADIRRVRHQWLAKYKQPGRENRWTEKIDTELAQRLFITTSAAASLLGVARPTVLGLAARGRLPCYQTIPGHRGSRLWFSRRAVLQLLDDSHYLMLRARERAGRAQDRKEPSHAPQRTRMIHEKVPNGWLTTREAAARLGVGPRRVLTMRKTGRLWGEQIWRGNKPLKYWYFPDYEVKRYLAWREQAKEAAGQPLLVPASSASLPLSAAKPLPPPASRPEKREAPAMPVDKPMRLDAEGPEPRWACDDADLRRAFFLLDRLEG